MIAVKKIISCLILLCLIRPLCVQAQTMSSIFDADPSYNARPYSHSGLTNRIIEEIKSTFNINSNEEFLSEFHAHSAGPIVMIPTKNDANLSITVWDGMEGDELYIYQRLSSNKVIDFNTFLTLIQLIEPNMNSEDLQSFYNQWQAQLDENHKASINGHEFHSYGLNHSSNPNQHVNQIEIRFNFPLTTFKDEELTNLSGSFYDTTKEFPSIYDHSNSDATAYLDRMYINNLLYELQQTFGFDLTENHLSAWGGTVYFYPTELAELGRLNEFYLFSGETSSYQTIELRFTHAYEEDNPDIKANQLLMIKSYFHLFAKLLNPYLTEKEINSAFDNYTEEGNTELGDIVIRREGFTDNTISMSRRVRYKLEDVQLDYILSVPDNQASQVLIPSETMHEATVPQINPVEKIFAQTNYDHSNIGEVFGSDANLKKHYEDKVIQVLNDLPHHKEVLEISGDILLDSPDNWMIVEPKSDEDFQYQVYIGDLDFDIDEPVEIQAYNLGIQLIDRKKLMLIPITIKQNGQTIYSLGGDINE